MAPKNQLLIHGWPHNDNMYIYIYWCDIYMAYVVNLILTLFKRNIQNSTFQPFHSHRGYPHRECHGLSPRSVSQPPRICGRTSPGPNPWMPSIHLDPGKHAKQHGDERTVLNVDIDISILYWAVVEPTHLKHMLVKFNHFPGWKELFFFETTT